MCYSHCYHLLKTHIVVLANEELHLDGENPIDLEESTFWKNESNVIPLAQHYAIAHLGCILRVVVLEDLIAIASLMMFVLCQHLCIFHFDDLCVF